MARLPTIAWVTLLASVASACATPSVTTSSAASSAIPAPTPSAPPTAPQSVDGNQPCDPRPSAPEMGVGRGSGAPERVDEFEQWLGCSVDYVLEFPARDYWQQIGRPEYMLEIWADDDRTLVLGVAMLPDKGDYTMAEGLAGAFDEYFRSFGEALVAAGRQDSWLRIGWEFNGHWSRYFTEDAESFRMYWRRIVEVLREVEGQQFTMVWNPAESGDDAVPYYPGDDVVDLIGVDVYDSIAAPGAYPYPAVCDDECRLGRQQTAWLVHLYGGDTGLKYYTDFARSIGKPLVLPEWGLWDRPDGNTGGENPYFIRQMHDFIYDPDNNVEMHAYFEYNYPGNTHRMMTSFPESGEVFRELFVYDGE